LGGTSSYHHTKPDALRTFSLDDMMRIVARSSLAIIFMAWLHGSGPYMRIEPITLSDNRFEVFKKYLVPDIRVKIDISRLLLVANYEPPSEDDIRERTVVNVVMREIPKHDINRELVRLVCAEVLPDEFRDHQDLANKLRSLRGCVGNNVYIDDAAIVLMNFVDEHQYILYKYFISLNADATNKYNRLSALPVHDIVVPMCD
jgi:hypothetical protein